jgi:hypothetical protein
MLGLSKSHVRNVLNAAEKLGTLSHGERRRRIRLSAVFLAETRSHLLNLAQLVARTHECALVLSSRKRHSRRPCAFLENWKRVR